MGSLDKIKEEAENEREKRRWFMDGPSI